MTWTKQQATAEFVVAVVHLLVNPSARKGKAAKTAAAAARLFAQHGVKVVSLTPESAADVQQTISDAQKHGMERLVIVGGDGMVHHALPAVAETDITVGIIPSGTGNDFSRALGLPTKTEAAVRAALGESSPVDLIRRDQSWAASVVTGGWSGDVNERAERLRFPKGQQRYTVATLLELGALKPVELRLEMDDNVFEREVTLFAIGNTAYFGGGMKVCPAATEASGELEIAVLEAVTARQLIPIIPKIFSGKHIHHPKVTMLRGSSIKIETPAALWADGETFGAGNALLECVPGAAKIAGVAKARTSIE